MLIYRIFSSTFLPKTSSQTDKAMLRKVNQLIEAIRREPFNGLGKPEPLRHDLRGYWSRRITDKHRLVYFVAGDTVDILQCRYHYEP